MEMDKVFSKLQDNLVELLSSMKPAELPPDGQPEKEYIAFDGTVSGNEEWKRITAEHLKNASRFEIHCWSEEAGELALALRYGEIKPFDWDYGSVVEGEVTPQFIEMLLDSPKPTDTEIYNKMTPFFTINLDDSFCSAHYGTELIFDKAEG